MQGIYAVISNSYKKKPNCENANLKFETEANNAYFAYATVNKFMNDKIMHEDDEWIVIFDGFLLNKSSILENNNRKSIESFLISSAKENELAKAINSCRGSYAGILYNKSEGTLYCFNDQWSTKPLFYSSEKENFIVSANVNAIAKYYKENDIPYKLNLAGAYSLLTYAFMYGDNTLIEGVRRLPIGSILKWKNGKIDIEQYHTWSFDEKKIEYGEAIEKIDNLFLHAVRMQVEKNGEYGYKNVIPLSAGLDCRMTSFAINRLGTTGALNYSYSESGQPDAILPAQMARKLKNQWFFKNLDNGLDLCNIEESVCLTDGLIYYAWTSQLNAFLKEMNTENWGIVHTGVIGDVVIGCFDKSVATINKKYELGDGAYSVRLLRKLSKYVQTESCMYEEGMMLNRAINGACMGYSTSFCKYADMMSPFMDVDFAEFCFSLPKEYRFHHKIYYDWVLTKYPDAAKFPHNGVRISKSKLIKIKGKSYSLKSLTDVIKNKLLAKNKKIGMNPMEYWYNSNPDLRKVMDSYYENHVNCLKNYEGLYTDINDLYKNGSCIEKVMAISLIGSYIMMFKV